MAPYRVTIPLNAPAFDPHALKGDLKGHWSATVNGNWRMKEAYLDPLALSVTEFARRIGISRKCASEFVNKHAGMSVEMAHRLAQATDTTAEFWLTMQDQCSPWEAGKAKVPEQIKVQRLAFVHA